MALTEAAQHSRLSDLNNILVVSCGSNVKFYKLLCLGLGLGHDDIFTLIDIYTLINSHRPVIHSVTQIPPVTLVKGAISNMIIIHIHVSPARTNAVIE